MTTLKIAWRNVWRNPRRSVLTMLALAFSTAMLLFMFAWQGGSYDAMIHAAVSTTTGELQVVRRGYQDDRDMRKVVADPRRVAAFVDGVAGVRASSPRAEAFAMADSGRRAYGVLVVGVDPEREPRVSNIRSIVAAGRYFSGAGTEILLGRRLADNLQAAPGSEVVLLGQGLDGSVAAGAFTVCGLVESGQPELDRTLVQIPMPAFEETFFMRGGVHRIVVNCGSLDDIGPVKEQLAGFLRGVDPDLEVLSWDQLMPGLKESIELDLISGYIFYCLLLVVVAFSIMNTFIMAVMERTREFGILNAIGSGRGRLAGILWAETMLLGLCGIGAGLAAGIAVTWYAQVHGILIPEAETIMAKFGLPDRIRPQLTLFTVWLAPALVLAVTFCACVYPSIRLLRLRPVRAMQDR